MKCEARRARAARCALTTFFSALGCVTPKAGPVTQPAAPEPSPVARPTEARACDETPDELVAPINAVELEIEYANFGLAAFDCDEYRIVVRPNRDVRCGQSDRCRDETPCLPRNGSLAEHEVERLAGLAGSPRFRSLPSSILETDVFIMGGTGETISVFVGQRFQEVTIYNSHAAPFTELREALEEATGCAFNGGRSFTVIQRRD
jgi:hypothetical protein